MLNSADRMSFIIEYISAYEEKIKLANNNCLFDNAKLFEVFAIEICNIWFNQKFSNLNDVKPNFSYVDLISADKKLYVQVTTNQNVPQKIKNTLKKINFICPRKVGQQKKNPDMILSGSKCYGRNKSD